MATSLQELFCSETSVCGHSTTRWLGPFQTSFTHPSPSRVNTSPSSTVPCAVEENGRELSRRLTWVPNDVVAPQLRTNTTATYFLLGDGADAWRSSPQPPAREGNPSSQPLARRRATAATPRAVARTVIARM